MVSRLLDEVIVCSGGKISNQGSLLQGSAMTGTAKVLQNFEPAIEGGYRRINGFTKYDSNEIAGQGAVLGVLASPEFQEVFAARLNVGGTQVDLWRGAGSGWTKVSNTVTPSSSATKYRMISYLLPTATIIMCDGQGHATKYTTAGGDVALSGTSAPADPKFAALYLSRLVLSGYDDGAKIILTVPNDDEDFNGSGAIEINVGDTVTGLYTFREKLYIFCLNSIFRLDGSSSSDFVLTPITRSGVGCVAGDTIQEVGGDLVFLSSEGLRSLAATERIGDLELGLVSRAIQPELRTIVNKASYNEDSYSSCIVAGKSQYRMFLYDSGLEDADAMGWIGRRTQTQEGFGYEWSNIAGFNCYCADSGYFGTDEVVVHGDVDSGYVYRQEQGYNRDGDNIHAVYTTPDLVFENAELRKVMHWMRLYTQVEGDLAIDLQLLFNFEDEDVLQPQLVQITDTGTVSRYGTAVYNTDVYSIFSEPVIRANLTGSGITVSFVFSSNDTKESYRIDSFQVVFAPKGRR